MVRRQVKRLSTLEGTARPPAAASFEGDLDLSRGPEWFLDLAVRRARHRPLRVTIGQLIAVWQARTLSNTIIQRVQMELERHSLVVEPGLRGRELATVVEIRRPDHGPTGEADGIGYNIGDIESARNGLYCVDWNEQVTGMFDEMLRSKRDHVGVTDEEGRLIGCANWIEVCCEMQSSPETLAGQVARPAREVHASEKLFSLTSDVIKHGFVCVVDDTGAVTGAVNCADIAKEHERRLLPLSMIEEIEARLRRRITGRVQVRYEKRNGKVVSQWKQRERLTFGDYVALIKEDETFKQMGWGMPGSRLGKAVDRVRTIRNAVFHHKPGRPNQDDVTELEALLRSLEGFDSSSTRNLRKPGPSSE
ncbi:hypothetical protein [Glycomyces xiaoerkulensis]|uniref:hypothetical protein n=1 Tax=Glycomyces xiaoerkulensis TaxID=2038139 RepID=UPI0012FFFA0E|nr:hypothetical protein [Glycomyces xiaoerkulensis]